LSETGSRLTGHFIRLRAHAAQRPFRRRDEFQLAAIVQNLKTMALRLLGPPPDRGSKI
jgi:hypothetical protein